MELLKAHTQFGTCLKISLAPSAKPPTRCAQCSCCFSNLSRGILNLNSPARQIARVCEKMTEVVSLMDIDEDENQNHNQNHSLKSNKGKNVVVAGTTPDAKATPWVEKYRPQSLADVAAHRDIVDTSNYFLFSFSSRVFTVYVYNCICVPIKLFEFFNQLIRSFRSRD